VKNVTFTFETSPKRKMLGGTSPGSPT